LDVTPRNKRKITSERSWRLEKRILIPSGQFLSQLPESVKKQDTEFQNSLRDTLKTEDARYFGEQVLPGIQSNFAKAGRDFNSSAFANAAAGAAQGQNTAREGFLSNLSASAYSGNKANAYNEYLNSVGRMNANSDYSRMRSDQLTDAATGRVNDIQNFAMQKQAYDDYLSRYGKRSSGLGGLIGGSLVLESELISVDPPARWSVTHSEAALEITLDRR
jgi:hypothetical protein